MYPLLPGHDLRRAVLRTQLMHSSQALVLAGILHAGGHHCTPGGSFSVQLGRLVISSHNTEHVGVPERKPSVMSSHQKRWCSSHSPFLIWISPSKTTTGGKNSLKRKKKKKCLVLDLLEIDVLCALGMISLALPQIESFTVTFESLAVRSQSPRKWLYEKPWEAELQEQRPLLKLMLLLLGT